MAIRKASAVVALLVLVACAGSSDPSKGLKALEAVVVGREQEAPGSAGASYQGTGNYYLVFEAREGTATSTYRFLVTERQFRRYPEGSRVQIVILDNTLREIRPLP
jgi:hypothetical protein